MPQMVAGQAGQVVSLEGEFANAGHFLDCRARTCSDGRAAVEWGKAAGCQPHDRALVRRRYVAKFEPKPE